MAEVPIDILQIAKDLTMNTTKAIMNGEDHQYEPKTTAAAIMSWSIEIKALEARISELERDLDAEFYARLDTSD